MYPLEKIPGIGDSTVRILRKLGVSNTEELITFYPFRYDVIKRSNLIEVEQDDKVILDGIVDCPATVFYIHKTLNKMSFKMQTNTHLLTIVIFNRGFLKNKIKPGEFITIFGKYDKRHNTIIASDIRFSKLPDKVIVEPVYHTVYGISSKKLQGIMVKILSEDITVEDLIPNMYQEKYQFLSKEACIRELHVPVSIETLKKARLRTKYEELFVFMIKMQYLKNNQATKKGLTRVMDWSKIEEFIKTLPFDLTTDQIESVQSIYEDLKSPKRMNRLLQGDVGSGKTVVSILAMYMNYLAGYQSALMAPTEILSIQHYQNIKELFKNNNIQVELLTGKIKAKEKREIYRKLETGEIDIIIGTHALTSDKVVYQNLGLVITDEQHRFGVNQRSNLKNKGITPDILYMSATPIPRTYALTLYGDMDVSNIKTVPTGRKKIITEVKKNKEIKSVLGAMYEELQKGHQVYVIAPLIEESEKVDLENVDTLSEKMNAAFGKKYKIGVLHGKLTGEDKEQVMEDFQSNKVQILISTTVVEVGVDVKNATMIVIFDAFRFGLSTLHQLRGRVGRNSLQSYCFLISDAEKERLRIMETTSDGFEISEEDFRLRGSGDLFGIKQSGDMRFMLADIKKDFSILMRAKEDSEKYLVEESSRPYVEKIISTLENLS